ncbi:MAG: nucleoside 2-deoxyribosyltransferase [Phycisphaerae bacterium]|nr:nucleoside 2-deoxyribosyltransferase [Phycisphaerae bacterium]
MGRESTRVYCAGPLFNDKEREEMALIAAELEGAGYETFLPQRDGLELSRCVEDLVRKGLSPEEANSLMCRAIFALDVYQVLRGCDALVANLNGRVPDEGTVSEAAMAWSRGKAVVGYKADNRSTFGGQDNPLVTGLFDFRLCSRISEITPEVARALDTFQPPSPQQVREEEISQHVQLGERMWTVLKDGRSVEKVLGVITEHVNQSMSV